MNRYRKKPVVIEAVEYSPQDIIGTGRLVGWLMAGGCDFKMAQGEGEFVAISIITLEGAMTAQPGDWIIKGVQGEFYPCKPDIFEATYEPVEPTEERQP